MSSEKAENFEGAQRSIEASILVVDDEPSVRQVMRSILSSDGHNVVLASDGGEAIRLLQQRRFDLVFTDLTMPGISGWEVVASVKRLRGDIPVIVFTGWAAGLDDAEVERRGANGIVHKPFDMAELLDLVSRIMGDTR